MDDKEHDEQPNAARGYRPLVLTLTGFKGIRSGLSRDTLRLDVDALAGDATLVAIAGANGRGKTTVMDNLHPYLVMPSRAGPTVSVRSRTTTTSFYRKARRN